MPAYFEFAASASALTESVSTNPVAIESAVRAFTRKLPNRDGDAEETDLDTISLFACNSDVREIAHPPGAISLMRN
jgi:hypothetical protein